jgi:hypothetical protein
MVIEQCSDLHLISPVQRTIESKAEAAVDNPDEGKNPALAGFPLSVSASSGFLVLKLL